MAAVRDVYGSLDDVKIVTLAPEIPGAMNVIPALIKQDITVSLGHSTADLQIGEDAARHGASLITHLFNAMLPFHHRDPGLVGLLTTDNAPPVYYGIIADGVHTHPAALRIAWHAHPKGVVLVTDAISALGLPEGTHHLGELSVEVKNGKAFIAGTSTLCGSIASMEQCVRFFHQAASCSVVQALEAASLHPAQALGLDDTKGTLNFNADADFVMLSDDLHVRSTCKSSESITKSASALKLSVPLVSSKPRAWAGWREAASRACTTEQEAA
uniref:N-acetylglucosamine-6-phosphate deacetylase n=1 Tax=Homalodisca liturata TaxID=320908 RepID=A0A1B6JIX3_9HEMI